MASEIAARSESVARNVLPSARLLSVKEVAELLRGSEWTIYDWRSRGEGPKGMKLGRSLRFDPADVAGWLEQRKAESSTNDWIPDFKD